ncbi:MAG: hypothetical protein GXY54_07145 [Deltaproteobacteria bacterium]|nr:hypothetical protein [Deltaproteobacteria bacterium]
MDRKLNEVLVLLRGNEMAMNRLYQQYAESFPEDRVFWLEIGDQEFFHAEEIDKLRGLVAAGSLYPAKVTIQAEAIKANIGYINNLIEECRRGSLSKKKAYTLALDLEKAILERKFLNILNFSMSEDYKSVRDKLLAETESHRQHISAKLSSLK